MGQVKTAKQILNMLLMMSPRDLGPLQFLAYVNDLPNVSRLLDPIMFADDTNLFFNFKDS